MIPKKLPVRAGLDVIGPDGEVYRIRNIYGRGRSRTVVLDRPPRWSPYWPFVPMAEFRQMFTIDLGDAE